MVALSEKRKAELEPLSIKVYRQLQTDHPTHQIRAQFERVEGLDPDELAWVLQTGKQRYAGYYDAYRTMRRKEALGIIALGAGMLVIVLIVIAAVGWPTYGRARGTALAGITVGMGGIGYGLWFWITAEPPGRRADIDEL